MTAQQFVLEIGRAMHALGSPSYRIEDTMQVCCRSLGLEGAFFSTPTAIFVALGAPGSEMKTALLRVEPGDHDLARLAEMYAVRDAVISRVATPTDGLQRIREVLGRTTHVSPAAAAIAHGLAGAGAGVLFGGGFTEAAFAGAAGLLVGMLGAAINGLARRRPGAQNVRVPLSCALAAFVVHGAAALGVPLQPTWTTLAAIVALAPGFSFTTALSELAVQHLASGSARLLGTLALLLTMVVGVGIGDTAAGAIFGPVPPEGVRDPLGWPSHVLALLVIWSAYSILLRAKFEQVAWVLFAVVIGYGAARFGGLVLGSGLGAFLGAVIVTLAANAFEHWRRQPAAIVGTPGLLLLVPGSVGFRGLSVLATNPAAASDGINLLLQMLIVGGSIVAGLLIAGVVLPPPLEAPPKPPAAAGPTAA